MDEKVILITGASGGMGSYLAEKLQQQGFKLALHANRNPIRIAESEKIAIFKSDLCDELACEQLIQAVIKRFGRLDVLINNAGISRSNVIWKTKQADWEATMNINLDVPFYLSKYAVGEMRKSNWGRIVNISSVVAQTGFIGTSAYAASKAGLVGLTKTLSKETASFGITVNALALGYFNTGMISDVPEEIREEIIAKIPVKKLGDPETVCKMIELLISEAGGYITGQEINLNGGLHG